MDTAVEAKLDYGTDLISIVNDFIYESTGQARPVAASDCLKRVDGVMEGRVMDNMLLERPDLGSSMWVNSSVMAIWELCDGSLSIGEIAIRLGAEYDLAGEALMPDITTAVQQLRDIGFLTIAKPS